MPAQTLCLILSQVRRMGGERLGDTGGQQGHATVLRSPVRRGKASGRASRDELTAHGSGTWWPQLRGLALPGQGAKAQRWLDGRRPPWA